MPETENTATLVCPSCGSARIGTRERAEIWQRATFTLDPDGVVETAAGEKVGIDWEAYDSEDVGDTETVGYFCAECLSTWGEPGDTGTVPFIPNETALTSS